MKWLLPLLLFTVGCAGTYEASYDSDDKIWSVKYRSGETERFVPEERLEQAVAEPPSRAELIVELGKLCGDAGLGAELVIIAEEFGSDRRESAHENALRVTTWIHDQERERSKPRRRSWGDTERRAERAFRRELD